MREPWKEYEAMLGQQRSGGPVDVPLTCDLGYNPSPRFTEEIVRNQLLDPVIVVDAGRERVARSASTVRVAALPRPRAVRWAAAEPAP